MHTRSNVVPMSSYSPLYRRMFYTGFENRISDRDYPSCTEEGKSSSLVRMAVM